jgi:PAS domain S-box-containing protein
MTDPLRVLYVDDEPGLLEIGKLFLEIEGAFMVDTLTSARQALEQVKKERYDAIISDYQMPEMDGIAFLRQIKASGNQTPFIIFTGRGREEVVIEALNSGADFYLQKGGEPKSQFAELSHKIQTAVARKRTEKRAKDSERRLYDIINFLPDATFAIDNAGTVIAWNRAMEEMTGAKSSEIVGKGNYEYALAFYNERRPMLVDLVLAPDTQFEKDKYLYTSHDRTLLTAETTLEKPDRNRIHLWGKASLLFDESGNLTGAIESIRDITERKKANDELRAAYEQIAAAEEELRTQYDELKLNQDTIVRDRHFLSSIFSSIRDGISILDKNMSVLQVNPAMERWYAHAMPLVGKRCWEVYHKRSRPCEVCPSLQSLKTGEPANATVPMIGPDGTITGMIDLHSFPLRDVETGEITGIIEYVRDVTKRWKVMSQLEESETRFRQLSDATNDGLLMHKDGIIREVNTGACTLFGYSREELVGMNVLDLPSPGSKDAVREKMQTISEEPYEMEGQKKDGSRFFGILYSRNLSYNNQQIRLTSVRDITKSRQAEEELRAAYEQLTAQEEELRAQYDMLALNEAEWESTFNAISDWITLITPDGRILRTNKADESLLGAPTGQVLGMNCFELVHGTECPNDRCPRKRMLVSKKRESTEIPRQDGNGWLQVTVDPILNAAGDVISAVHIVRDISERMRSQKAMMQAKKKLNLLNYITFSDIQTLVFTLSGYQHLVKERVTEGTAGNIIGKQEEILQKISHSLKFARSYQDLGLKPARWQNVNQVFLLAISHLDFLRIRHTARLDGLEIFADPLLEQVFQVLAENTLTHGKTATQVTLRYAESPGSVTLFFEDDGAGIPADAKEKIFLPDFQKRKGVGLFLASEILDITGITIRETGEPGKGVRFEILVPKGAWRNTGERE